MSRGLIQRVAAGCVCCQPAAVPPPHESRNNRGEGGPVGASGVEGKCARNGQPTITLVLGIKFVFLLLALFDNASMWMAVFADMGARMFVVFNGLRLLKGVDRA